MSIQRTLTATLPACHLSTPQRSSRCGGCCTLPVLPLTGRMWSFCFSERKLTYRYQALTHIAAGNSFWKESLWFWVSNGTPELRICSGPTACFRNLALCYRFLIYKGMTAEDENLVVARLTRFFNDLVEVRNVLLRSIRIWMIGNWMFASKAVLF